VIKHCLLSLLAKTGGRRGEPDYADLTTDDALYVSGKAQSVEHTLGIIRLSA
jgi:hypothetical protein